MTGSAAGGARWEKRLLCDHGTVEVTSAAERERENRECAKIIYRWGEQYIMKIEIHSS